MSRAICLGEILIDCFTQQQGVARSEITDWTPLPGGGPANVACGLAKLGDRVDFIGAIGRDHWGDALVKLLEDMGVGHQGVQRRLKAPTRKVYLTNDESGDRTFAGFSESDPTLFADAHLFADALNEDLFTGASFLVLGTLSAAYPDARQSIEKALRLAKYNHVQILIDVNWRPMFWQHPAEAPGIVYDLINQAQFLKVSEAEAEWLFSTRSAATIAQQLPHLSGVLVTAGAKGCDYSLMGNVETLGAFDVDVEETMGAGDAFTAGFVHQLLRQGHSCLQDADIARSIVRYASAVSALTTTRPGAIAALPAPNEVEVFLYLN
ncbi:MAG: carbohydrate kinase [Cyanobacteria bacterium P01_A01_bin.116]